MISLAMFHPALKSPLYHYDANIDGDLVDQAQSGNPDYAPHLRIPKLGPLKYGADLVGAKVFIDYGVSSHIVMDGCNVGKFWDLYR